MPAATLYYVYDPMCSWCWAFRPIWLQLRESLPAEVQWQNVLGGLAPDNDQPMPDNLQTMIQGHWRQIQSTVGTEFNFDFWRLCQPRRDTYKACRAVIAAAQQQAEENMIEAIQKAYYLSAQNPSDLSVLAQLATGLGLNRVRFDADLISEKVDSEFQRQLLLRDKLNVKSFPSLVLVQDTGVVGIRHDYQDYRLTLSEIESRL